MTRDELFNGVCLCLAKSLDIAPESIRESDRIIDDLGMDSLDLLQLIFLLEQQFQTRIVPREIERRAREKLGGAPLDIDGVYTAEGLAELRLAMPEVPAAEWTPGLTTGELPRRFRVTTMMNLVAGCFASPQKDAP